MGEGGQVLEDLDSHRLLNREIFDATIDYFDSHTTPTIIDITWVLGIWKVTVPESTIVSSVPLMLVKSPSRYTTGKREPPKPLIEIRRPGDLI